MGKNKWKQRPQEEVATEVVEAPVAAAVTKAIVQQPLVEFAAWFASRASKIPAQHHKEILWADFKARGLGKVALMKEYDEALKKYGVQLV